uniref:Uncharacterized protein n=1 Tax=Romanomermis culicivorax TaxID=13658 RepID=A0A915IWE9_ROMCU
MAPPMAEPRPHKRIFLGGGQSQEPELLAEVAEQWTRDARSRGVSLPPKAAPIPPPDESPVVVIENCCRLANRIRCSKDKSPID